MSKDVDEADKAVLKGFPYSENQNVDYHSVNLSCTGSPRFDKHEVMTARKLNNHCLDLMNKRRGY